MEYFMSYKSDFQLTYCILPANPPRGATFIDLHNTIYEFWRSLWSQTFSQSGAPDKMWNENFLRQDFITAIMNDREIVGCHLYTLYNLDSKAALSSEYFHYFGKDSLEHLKKNAMGSVLSMEYLCVNPKYRKLVTNIPFGEIFIGLGSELTKTLGYDCCLGTTINGAKVDQMAELYGGYSIQEDIKKYGYTLRLMVIPMNKRVNHPNIEFSSLIQTLWEDRVDYTGATGGKIIPFTKRKVA